MGKSITIFLLISIINFTSFASESDDVVVVCLGKYAKVYHSTSNCRGLSNCKSEITSTTSSYASIAMNRRPCCICISGITFGCDTDPINDITKFNPYVPQIPSVMYSPEYLEYARRRQEAEAKAYAEGIVALGKLLGELLTRTPEQKERTRIRKLIRQNDREERRKLKVINEQKKELEKKTNDLKISGTQNFENRYTIKGKNKILFWGISSISLGSIGIATSLISNNLYKQYLISNTNQANSLHKQIDTFDAISSASFILSGITAIEFLVQKQKSKNQLGIKLKSEKNTSSVIKLELNYSF